MSTSVSTNASVILMMRLFIATMDNAIRSALFLPSNRLRGFTVIGLTNNAIKRLPSESKIKEKFPELRAIDAEGNKDFDCDTLSEYETIKVYSDCEGGDSAIIIHGQRLPDIEEPTATCDFECQVKKHYRALHNYLIRIWQMLKAKYEEMDKEKIVNDVKDFFLKLADRVNNNLNEIQLRMKNRDTTEHTPTRLVSATTTTRGIN
ncbi:unnamed protein product [Anisakis simplex]|uniref:Uncharacterized protein n=1 Tax=Anisakis simplex TaxID=6269 RepID=A0A0M3JRW5_ANISI|nr:unnamed protein product [Anisakis simplex]